MTNAITSTWVTVDNGLLLNAEEDYEIPVG